MKSHRIGIIPLILATATFSVISAGRTARAADRSEDPLLKQVNQAIEISKRRYLTANYHTPWQIMHGLLALRGEYEVKDPTGRKKINAAEWIASGVYHGGEPWFQKTPYGGRAHPYTTDYVFQGHSNQFLAMMAVAGFPPEYKLKAGRETITVQDLVNNSKMEVSANEECTWTLWALSHYLGPAATWTNKHNQPWSIERLVEIQLGQPLSRAPCGGTHGLFALSYARNMYVKSGKPLRGVWLKADNHIKQYIARARSMQNSDGSFSSEYFQGSGYSNDFETRLGTSGHTLEFLMLALPQNRLHEQWVRNGVASVARDLIANRNRRAEPGALYHALDGLVLFRSRVAGVTPRFVGERDEGPVEARKPKKRSRTSRTAAGYREILPPVPPR